VPNNYQGLASSPEMRRTYQLDYSIHMISDIAAEYDGVVDRGSLLCARSMLDAFYVHVRLLADFLVKATKGGVDFGPADFGVEWKIPTTAEAGRLGKYWDTASKYVVHFGHPRVPDDLEEVGGFEIGSRAFKAMAADSLIVFAEFMRRLESQTPPWSEGSRIPDQEAEPHAWRDRMLSDRTNLLHDSFIEACGKVGLDGERLLSTQANDDRRLPRIASRPTPFG